MRVAAYSWAAVRIYLKVLRMSEIPSRPKSEPIRLPGQDRRADDDLALFGRDDLPRACRVGVKLTREDLVRRSVDDASLSRMQATAAVRSVIQALSDALTARERIELRGFGVFEVVERAGKIGRDPKKGTPVPIPPCRAIRFKPGKNLRGLLR